MKIMREVECSRIFCQFNSFRTYPDSERPHCLRGKITLNSGGCSLGAHMSCVEYKLVEAEEKK
jgi:hypothetical protein